MSLNVPRLNLDAQNEDSLSSDPFKRCSTPNQRVLRSPRYEQNPDGEVEFRYEIDVSDYRPEEVKVSQSGHIIMVDASCIKTTEAHEQAASCSRSEKKEYHKTITLPQNADISRPLHSQYERGGRLVIRVPVNCTPSTSSLSSGLSAMPSSSSPSSRSSAFFPGGQSPAAKHGDIWEVPGTNSGRRLYYERLTLDPEFTRNDIKVSVNGLVVRVNARRQENDEHGCLSTRQYSSDHKFPANTDLDQIQADLANGELRLSAPYK